MSVFAIAGLDDLVAGTTDTGTTYRLRDGELVITNPPYYPEIVLPPVEVRKVMKIVADLEKARGYAASNANLSEAGKKKHIEPYLQAAREAMTKARTALSDYAGSTAQKAMKALAVPELDVADAVGAMEDREIRDWVRSRGEAKSGEVVEEMQRNPRVVQAVLRSPIGFGMLGDTAERLWRQEVEPGNPEYLEAKRRGESVKWAEDQLYWIEKHVVDRVS